MKNNHIIDPSYFDDVIEQFAFDYVWLHNKGLEVDELGNQKNTYEELQIRGSLQPQNYRREMNKEGNTESRPYQFYCKSIYRIDVNDVIVYKNTYLMVNAVAPYDEYGVRRVDLESIDIAQYRDLQDAIKCLTGEVIP